MSGLGPSPNKRGRRKLGSKKRRERRKRRLRRKRGH